MRFDANQHETRFEYDVRNQLIKTYADGTTVTKTYDGVGRTLSETDQAGKTTKWSAQIPLPICSGKGPF